MAKGKKRRKMPLWRRVAKGAIGATGVVIGSLVATSPFHRGVRTMATGNLEQGVADLQFDLGVPGPGERNVQPAKLAGAAVAAAAGVGIILLFRLLARRA